ncbi:MAG: hypothetical protein VX519_09665 [Myxococcota bacterium]|nr:hypothetical protein [Myxococcota bacterium]
MKRTWWLVLLGMTMLVGCMGDRGVAKGQVWTLEVEIVENPAVAGDEVGYTAALVKGRTGEEQAVEVVVSSDIELDLEHNEEILVAFVAGEHALTFTGTHEGGTYTTEVVLTVAPATPNTLDLELEDLATRVGQPLGLSVEILDLWGNAHDPAIAEITVDPEATILDSKVSTTVPGLYVVTAAHETLVDSEQFMVLSGEPVAIDLQLSDSDLELHETTVASVLFTDLYGNNVDAPWLLWVEPMDGITIRYNTITFDEEGQFTVFASNESGTLQDTEGLIQIDSTGPELTVDTPERGTRTTDVASVLSGTALDGWSGVSDVSVNGESCPIDEQGAFECPLDYEFGLNLLETEAVDGDGNATTDTRTVLSGNFSPYGSGVDPGMMVRINEPGFDVLEEMASGFVDVSTIASAIPSPVFQDSSQNCYDPCFGWFGGCEFCVTWYEIVFYLQNFTIDGTEIDLDPVAAGYLDTMARILRPYMTYSANGTLLGIGYSASGYVQADHIQLDMDLTPSVNGGQIQMATSNASASTSNFDFDLDGWVYDVVSFFGINVDSIVEGYLVDALVDMANDDVPDLVNGALEDLEISETFEISDQYYDLDAIPSGVSVDDLGLTLNLETFLTSQAWVHPFVTDPGSLVYPYTPPSMGATGMQLELGLNQDFLNQVFFALWGGGVLEMEQTEEDLGLDMEDLALFLPSLSALTVQTSAWLPPVVVPGTGTSAMDLQVGDLELAIFDGEPIDSNLFLRLFVTIVAGLDLDATPQNTLAANLGDLQLHFDVVAPTDGTRYTASTEAFLEALLPLLLPVLTDSLGEIPIPDFSGFTMGALSMSLDGPELGFVVAAGDLQ